MRVRTIMTHEVTACRPETTLGEAARKMREIDSGMLPVVGNKGLVGVITDRDICLALAQRDRRPSEAAVANAMSREILTCGEEENVRNALSTMKARRIRRLPVVNARGELTGVLSMNDVILHSEPFGDVQAVSYEETVKTLQSICEHRYPVPAPRPADVTELARSL